ncbi:hypothetical protein CIB48_g1729 [Xylaria polymorpha]|nr:hypothetical protein CIB48_g1729 [Xylaria polymorpha]
MPSSTTQSHARSHALLLLQKLLNLRDSASPLTLVLDTLEQSGKPILREFMSRAQISKTKIIYISFATPRKPVGVDILVRARGKTAESLRSEIVSHYPSGHTHIGLYHIDVPVSVPAYSYAPHPLTILSHLATAVLRASNLHHAIEQRQAQNRSQQAPEFGLGEGKEGVLVGLGLRNGKAAGGGVTGLVLEMELRRRSGRAVAETFVLVPGPGVKSPPPTGSVQAQMARLEITPSKLYLLSDHPAFLDPQASASAQEVGGADDEPETTFNLGLTEKQRRDREGIVLPYFDAQTDIGAGEGGRILYDMGREDDFDEEEDEI